MKKLLILLTLFAYTLQSNAQSWKKSSGGDEFDGKYKTSSVIGKADNYPYTKPSLVINKFENDNSINFYIASSGYWSEDSGVSILWVFSNEPNTIYSTYDWSYSADNKILFFKEFNNPNSDLKLSAYEFIDKLRKASKVSVRISNDYGKNNMSFSLSGSTNAINHVLPNLDEILSGIEKKNTILKEAIKERDSLISIKTVNFSKILSEKKVKDSSGVISKIIDKLKNEDSDIKEKLFKDSTSLSIVLQERLKMGLTYGYIDIFFVFEDGTKLELDGSFSVEMDSPVITDYQKKKETEKKQAEEREKENKRKIKEAEDNIYNLTSKFQIEELRQSIKEKVLQITRSQYGSDKFDISDIENISGVFSKYLYKKIWDLHIKIYLTDGRVISDASKKVYLSSLKNDITKKTLKTIGAKLNEEF